ncbi:hypothetical protein C5167_001427 [Papaver somniferum]|uniref:RNase H type-1 domain-containing protein n=1 Tax=Papaver somniferum TaxID=3469 RepID=A0A4Y7KYF2_PAPSO|nr:hypothetical protein C5167_001427 [Papaver somniferum]
MMESDEPTAMISAPMDDCVRVSSQAKKGSIGLILRDCAGNCLGAKGICCNEEVEEDYGAEYFECKALKVAVDWMEELRATKVIFELDCESVVNSIAGNELQVHWFNQNKVQFIKVKFNSSNF